MGRHRVIACPISSACKARTEYSFWVRSGCAWSSSRDAPNSIGRTCWLTGSRSRGSTAAVSHTGHVRHRANRRQTKLTETDRRFGKRVPASVFIFNGGYCSMRPRGDGAGRQNETAQPRPGGPDRNSVDTTTAHGWPRAHPGKPRHDHDARRRPPAALRSANRIPRSARHRRRPTISSRSTNWSSGWP